MRLFLLAIASSLVIAAATFACSSSDPPAEEEGTESPENEQDGKAPPPINTPEKDAAPRAPVEDASTDTSTPFDANFDAGVLCMGDDTKETEANDTPETADTLSGIPSTYCGRLAAGESDYASFTLNAAQFTSAFNYSNAAITVTATVEGQTFDLDSDDYIYMQGKKYVLKITAASATDYRLRLLP
jgi:hypothetical protein